MTGDDSEMITITQTYTFAGKTHTETKVVPRSSAQAQVYLANHTSSSKRETPVPADTQKKGPEGQILLKPLRRVSKWDPNPLGIIKNLPTTTTSTTKKDPKAQRLNVVDKSKLDWAKHVDQIGAKDELEAAAKAKGSYLDRRGFLDRVEGFKEDELREARKK